MAGRGRSGLLGDQAPDKWEKNGWMDFRELCVENNVTMATLPAVQVTEVEAAEHW